MSGLLQLAVGSVFAGDFRIVRPLSEGGMGAVYVVEQLSTGKERALKVMQPGLVTNEKLRERFTQEARVASRIESEHVVEVVGAGVDVATGTPWLAMELLKGETLADRVQREGALAPNAVRELFVQLCHAIGAAHDAGIVHRDLKPENVFLAVSRRAGNTTSYVVKVLDFGIAKIVAEAKTKHTAAIGTPLWMAPEQTEVSAQINATADVWALGLIAFHLLTGRIYWRGAAVENVSAMMLMREVCFEPIVPASARSAELGGNLLPAGFDEWFARCVTRDIASRFPNAHAALAALEPAIGDAAVVVSSKPAPRNFAFHPTEPMPSPQPVPVAAAATEPLVAYRAQTTTSPSMVTHEEPVVRPNRLVPIVAASVLGAALVGGVAYFVTRTPSTPESTSTSSTAASSGTGMLKVPTAKETCKHVVPILLKDVATTKPTDEQQEKAMAACIKSAEDAIANDLEEYKCSAPCALNVDSMPHLKACNEMCAHLSKKKPAPAASSASAAPPDEPKATGTGTSKPGPAKPKPAEPAASGSAMPAPAEPAAAPAKPKKRKCVDEYDTNCDNKSSW